jgi:hypothetical protein
VEDETSVEDSTKGAAVFPNENDIVPKPAKIDVSA